MTRFLYIFFVGLFLAVFIGTGISVFYPAPQQPTDLYKELYPPVEGKFTEEQRLKQIEAEKKQQAYQDKQEEYNRNVSIIALGFAILILVAAMALSHKMGVIADGLLLGGVFTLLYGIVRGFATDDNQYRFIVSGIGLLVAVVLGYLKFKPKLK
jgi:hypothetical protein